MGHIQMKITLSIYIEKIQNLCSNSSSKCVLPKSFRPHLNIPYRSKVIDQTVTKGHFSTNSLSDYGTWITFHYRIFYPKFISRLLISRFWKNIPKRNSRANRKTSIFTPHHWLIIGICIKGNSLGHIQTKITLSIYIKRIQNLCSNSWSKCFFLKYSGLV